MRISDWSSDVCSSDLFGVDRREAGRHQQRVALAQGNRELLGEAQHQVPARRRAAGFDEAQVPLRDLGSERELELAETAATAPAAQHLADRRESGRDHGGQTSRRKICRPITCEVIDQGRRAPDLWASRSEEHTSELQSLMRISYAVFCL